ncbi:T9SS type A sorting domain-containing protein [Candidatus Fermentibacterales bacterium]|nr:T9SS type A sorting domain-containing protein [Candidatus Fermentibacterales bacterium]
MRTSLACLVLSLSMAGSDQEKQSSWCLGPGEQGPVPSWDEHFDCSVSVDWSDVLCLSSCFDSHPVDDPLLGLETVCAEDIDADGDEDIVGASPTQACVVWWENFDGTGTSWIQHLIDAPCNISLLRCADINGDGCMDVYCASWYDSALIWLENTDGSGNHWDAHEICCDLADANGVYAADVDGDADLDIFGIGHTYGDGRAAWWENIPSRGSIEWHEHTIEDSLGGGACILSEDIDGDGDMDAVGGLDQPTSRIVWWENPGSGSDQEWTRHTITTGFMNLLSLCSADIDLDGDPDVVGAKRFAGPLKWWENCSAGSDGDWNGHWIDGCMASVSYRSISLGYVDSDGYVDVLESDPLDNQVVWWQNPAASTAPWTKHVVFQGTPSYEPCAVLGLDPDDDGSTEVLAAEKNSGIMAWWEFVRYEQQGELLSTILYVGDPDWGYMQWVSGGPLVTSVAFQVRSSDDPAALGAWSDTLYYPCSLEPILDDHDGYFQYKAILCSSDSMVTPVLHEVGIQWDALGVEDEAGLSAGSLLPFFPNPTVGSPLVRFELIEASGVKILVYDVTGRLVTEADVGERSAGSHCVQLVELADGVYVCRMSCGDFTATQRFVVID